MRCLTIMKKQLIFWILVLIATSLLLRVSREWTYEPEKVEQQDKLGALIDQLAMCESGGLATAVNPFDGGSHSRGVLQFKDSTLIHYTKRYNLLPEAEDAEILNFIFDADYQKKLARLMLDENINNWRHWTNCSKKVGLNNFALNEL